MRLLHGLRLLLSGFGILLGSLGTLLLQLCEAFGVTGLLLLQSGYLFVDLLFLLVNADIIFLRLGIRISSGGLRFYGTSLGSLIFCISLVNDGLLAFLAFYVFLLVFLGSLLF